MAAKARVQFSTSGASSITGAFSKVGRSATGAGGKVGKFGSGIGSVFYKVMRNVGRMTMFSAGMQRIGKSAQSARLDLKGFSDGTVTALSAVSKKFAELRRQYHFFKFAGEKLAAPFKWASGKGKAPPTKAPKKQTKEDEILYRKFTSKEPPGAGKAASSWNKFFMVLRGGEGAFSRITKKIFNLKNVLKVLVVALTAVSVAGGVAFVAIGYQTAKFAKRVIFDFMNIREAFRQYEISLGGIIKNTHALGKVMNFATKYAAEYPAMFEEVLDTFRSLAALPALKPMFQKADEQDLKRLMDIVQGLATLDPLQGVRGAGIALREALSGDMRSVRRRFEIPAKAIADAGGYALEEITQDSEKALKAFHAFIQLNVPAKSMADAAMNIAIQVGNLHDKYRSFTNTMMKSTGAYWEVVTALSSINDWLTKVFASTGVKEWAARIGGSIRALVATLKGTMSDIDWSGYIDSGKIVEGLTEAAVKIAVFFRAMAEKFSAPFLVAVTKISKILWSGLMPVIGTLVKAMANVFWEGMKAAGKASMDSFASGLASGAVFTSIASFIYNAMVTIGKAAGTAFMSAFVGAMTLTGSLLSAPASFFEGLGETASKKWGPDDTVTVGLKSLADVLQTASDYWGKAPDLGEALSIDGSKLSSDANKAKEDLDKLKNSIIDLYDVEVRKISPEVVTPETPIKQQEWKVRDLKTQLKASEQIGDSLARQKSIINALERAEKGLARARALKVWEADYAGDRAAAVEQMKEYEAAVLSASKAGKDLGIDFYVEKGNLQVVLDNFDDLYGKVVDQKDAFKDLQSAIRSALGSMDGWTEKYKIAKKGAGSLLIVVQKLQDMISGKTPIKSDVLLALLKKRTELTDKNIAKEKQYRKEIINTAKAIAQSLIGLASRLQSSILSFTDTLKDAFLGIPKYEDGGAQVPDTSRYDRDRVGKIREVGEQGPYDYGGSEVGKVREVGAQEIKDIGSLGAAFGQKVLDKIKDIMMIPADMFGMGRAAMTYGEGYGQDALGQEGGIPAYIKYMLDGIRQAMAGGGISDAAAGRQALAEMRMGLLERALPHTAPGSEERAEIYAKMAGAQADIMKATLDAALEEIKMQKDQLAAAQETATNTSLALTKSDEVIQAIQKINIQAAPSMGSPSAIGNEGLSDLNPAMGGAF